MLFKRRPNVRELVKTFGFVLVAGAMIYAFSPSVRNQFGSVNPQSQRTPAGTFTVQTLDGSMWSLDNQRGRVVLVNFWATWCPPCRVETPALVDLHKRFAGRGFTVAGVTMDDDPASAVPAFARNYGIPYPILLPAEQLTLLNRVEALPTSVLIDKSGRVARTYVGMVTEIGLRDDIEALLSETEGGAR